RSDTDRDRSHGRAPASRFQKSIGRVETLRRLFAKALRRQRGRGRDRGKNRTGVERNGRTGGDPEQTLPTFGIANGARRPGAYSRRGREEARAASLREAREDKL